MTAAVESTYRDQVARVLAGTESQPVFNGTTDHACVVIEEAFKAAKRNVRLLTRSLNTACYGKDAVIAAARRFLEQGGRLSILVESASASDASHPFFRALAAHAGQIDVCIVPPEVVELYKYNFLVVDDVSFRFEQDRREHIATVAGGPAHADGTKNLTAVFSELRALSHPQALNFAA